MTMSAKHFLVALTILAATPAFPRPRRQTKSRLPRLTRRNSMEKKIKNC